MADHGVTYYRLLLMVVGPAALMAALLTAWHAFTDVRDLQSSHQARGEALALRLAEGAAGIRASAEASAAGVALAAPEIGQAAEVRYLAIHDGSGAVYWERGTPNGPAARADVFTAPIPAVDGAAAGGWAEVHLDRGPTRARQWRTVLTDLIALGLLLSAVALLARRIARRLSGGPQQAAAAHPRVAGFAGELVRGQRPPAARGDAAKPGVHRPSAAGEAAPTPALGDADTRDLQAPAAAARLLHAALQNLGDAVDVALSRPGEAAAQQALRAARAQVDEHEANLLDLLAAAGTAAPTPPPGATCDPRRLIEAAAERCACLARAMQVEIELGVQQDVPAQVHIDEPRAGRIVDRLLAQALHRGPASRLRLLVEHLRAREQEYLRIVIEREDVQGAAAEHGGSDDDLVVARALARRLGGYVEGTRAGGSCQSIWADVPITSTQTGIVTAARPAAQRTLDSLRILVADDNEINRRLLVTLIERQAGMTHVAHDGTEAVARALAGSYDCVLMDIQMPGLDGTDALRAIKQRRPQLPVIAVTAESDRERLEEFRHAGFDGVLVKPVTEEVIIEALLGTLKDAPVTDGESPQASLLREAPALDIDEAVTLAGGSRTLAAQLHAMLLRDLPDKLGLYLDETVNDADLLAQTHTLHGATRYCGTPKLRARTELLERALKGRTHDINVEDAKAAVIDAIQELLDRGDRFKGDE